MANAPGPEDHDYSRSRVLLVSYCKNTLTDICLQKKQAKDDNQKEILLKVYEEKCSCLIDEINRIKRDALSFVVVADIVQKIAQLLLDLTYVEECCLVDQDFMLQSAYERLSVIIETLSGIENLAAEAVPGSHPKDVLSPSIAECLHWRKGALLYMYCHTLNARCARDQLPRHFQECLQNGSRHLISMLSTRGSPQWLMGSEATSSEVGNARSAGDDGDLLLSQGIYSDTHLLALMYLGEMCYWYAQLQQPEPPLPPAHRDRASASTSSTHNSLGGAPAAVRPGPSGGRSALKLEGAGSRPGGAAPVSDQDEATEKKVAGLGLRQGDSLDMLKTGQHCLESYVKAAQGPMSAGGWSTNRAQEILQYFERLSL